jgi:hypothetical protein
MMWVEEGREEEEEEGKGRAGYRACQLSSRLGYERHRNLETSPSLRPLREKKQLRRQFV